MKTGGCPKCGGDIYDEVETYGIETKCLQCSFIVKTVEIKQYKMNAAALTPEQEKTAKRAAMEARNKEMKRLADGGATYKQIGIRYGLVKETVRQICQEEQNAGKI
jgi:DNA-binding CsgD family transcriptional regulator